MYSRSCLHFCKKWLEVDSKDVISCLKAELSTKPKCLFFCALQAKELVRAYCGLLTDIEVLVLWQQQNRLHQRTRAKTTAQVSAISSSYQNLTLTQAE
jgi:hypothetical protein